VAGVPVPPVAVRPEGLDRVGEQPRVVVGVLEEPHRAVPALAVSDGSWVEEVVGADPHDRSAEVAQPAGEGVGVGGLASAVHAVDADPDEAWTGRHPVGDVGEQNRHGDHGGKELS
jgi:hypothetical protein